MAGPDQKRRAPKFEALDPPKATLPRSSRSASDKPAVAQPAGQAVSPPPARPPASGVAPEKTQAPTPAAQFKSPQSAIAITYKTSAGAPRVVAKGRGAVAEQIIARAREHGVFVHESRELVALLMQVELDDHIPPALYRAVAELLAWLYHIEAARPGGGKV